MIPIPPNSSARVAKSSKQETCDLAGHLELVVHLVHVPVNVLVVEPRVEGLWEEWISEDTSRARTATKL